MRLILIDNYSGYIFGEFHTANYTGNFDMRACLTEAATTIDEVQKEYGRTYTVHSRAPRDTRGGYHVYRADVRGSEQVPVITDGQDPEIIGAVERDCEFMGFVEFKK